VKASRHTHIMKITCHHPTHLSGLATYTYTRWPVAPRAQRPKADNILAISLICFCNQDFLQSSKLTIIIYPSLSILSEANKSTKYDTTIVVLLWDSTHQRAVNDFKGYENN
jgi:hypothetical protein